MDSKEFRKRGKEMVDYIADYLDNIKSRRVTPDVEPGYLKDLLPSEAPHESESWDQVMQDVEDKIMPGITHWQHPRFHAYFPAGNSYPSILADMLSSGLGVVGFSWAASPACTELETIVLDWLGKMYGLPKALLPFEDPLDSHLDENMNSPVIKSDNIQSFFSEQNSMPSNNQIDSSNNNNNKNNGYFTPHCGGGVILGTASECVLVAMLSARRKAIVKYKRNIAQEEDGTILNRLVAYSSKLAHSCVEKAAMISLVKIRLLDTDENYSLRGETLSKAIHEDIEQGYIPFFVCSTLGTTSCCSYDNVTEIGPICQKYDIYLHVDAAYAGNALICNEFRQYMTGIEYIDSINSCPNKWMLINFDCSCLWVKDKYSVTQALSVDPIYLQYRQMDKTIDYRHWGIALSRRFRSLKLWFTIKSYGVQGLQNYIREHVRLAKIFERLVASDNRFEIIGQVTLGLVCFRLKGPDSLSKSLLYVLNDSGTIHLTPAILNDKYIIRFCVDSQHATEDDMIAAWDIIRNHAEQILKDYAEKSSQSLNKYQSDKFIQIDSLVDFSKMRRQCFTRMVSDPIKLKSDSLFNEQVQSFKKKISRIKTVQCYSDELKEDDDDEVEVVLSAH